MHLGSSQEAQGSIFEVGAQGRYRGKREMKEVKTLSESDTLMNKENVCCVFCVSLCPNTNMTTGIEGLQE